MQTFSCPPHPFHTSTLAQPPTQPSRRQMVCDLCWSVCHFHCHFSGKRSAGCSWPGPLVLDKLQFKPTYMHVLAPPPKGHRLQNGCKPRNWDCDCFHDCHKHFGRSQQKECFQGHEVHSLHSAKKAAKSIFNSQICHEHVCCTGLWKMYIYIGLIVLPFKIVKIIINTLFF